MRPILALAAKDLRLLVRDRGHLFFAFAWPLIVALFFGLLFGGPKEGAATITVAVVDEDASEGSRALVDRLGKTDGVKLTPLGRDEALAAVRRGTQVGAVIVPKGYGQASSRPFYGASPEIALAMDPSRRAEAAMLEGILMGAGMQGMERLFSDTGYSKQVVDNALAEMAQASEPIAGRDDLTRFLGELRSFVDSPAVQPQPGAAPGATGGRSTWKPLTITKSDVTVQRRGPRNAFMITFPQGVLWGVIGCAFGFALSLVLERTRGTLTRLQMSPLSRSHVLAGKALACFTTILIVQALLFAVATLYLQARRRALMVAAASAAVVVLASCSGSDADKPALFGTVAVLGASGSDTGNRCGVAADPLCFPAPPYASASTAANGKLYPEIVAEKYGARPKRPIWSTTVRMRPGYPRARSNRSALCLRA